MTASGIGRRRGDGGEEAEVYSCVGQRAEVQAPHSEPIVAVVVTWNRRELLAESLRGVHRQTTPPERVVVVDNASDDGTAEMLSRDFPTAEVVRTTTNVGGAGGFAVGLAQALRKPCSAVWLMDDDTIAEPTALAELVKVRVVDQPPPVLVASRVVWTNGVDHPMNTPRRKLGVTAAERRSAQAVDCLPIRSASFVSVLVDADAVRERGLPIADYFLWNDDFEFTTRLTRGRRALYCPASVVVHKTSAFGTITADPGRRFFYEVRNKVWLFTRSPGLNPAEKLVYGGSTLRRWAQTLVSSGDRGTLARGLLSGLRAGVSTRPRETAQVLSDAVAHGVGDG